MNPSQKDDDGQETTMPVNLEWTKVWNNHYGWELRCGRDSYRFALPPDIIDRILADRRDAQQLRERVQELEAERELELGHAHEDWLHVNQDEWEATKERVRVLEEALRDRAYTLHVFANHPDAFPCPREDCQEVDALLSPAAATEGGEGA